MKLSHTQLIVRSCNYYLIYITNLEAHHDVPKQRCRRIILTNVFNKYIESQQVQVCYLLLPLILVISHVCLLAELLFITNSYKWCTSMKLGWLWVCWNLQTEWKSLTLASQDWFNKYKIYKPLIKRKSLDKLSIYNDDNTLWIGRQIHTLPWK